jgi:plasmid stabilization system protein ParE
MLEIWDYTSNTWDPGQADGYLSGLAKFFDQLADRAVLWRKVEELR